MVKAGGANPPQSMAQALTPSWPVRHILIADTQVPIADVSFKWIYMDALFQIPEIMHDPYNVVLFVEVSVL